LKPLAPSPAWTLVTPYCKRTRPGHGTNTKAAGFPPLPCRSPAASLPPFALALDPSGLGQAATFTRRFRDPPPPSRNADNNEDDLISLFANLTIDQKKKLNELIETINEKDELLESQEYFLVKENKKFVKVKNAYAQEGD
jgi:hypothetical protein